MNFSRFQPKSKLTKVNVSWAIIITVGLLGFVIARRSVERNRVEVMKSRQRILEARRRDGEEKYGGHSSGESS